MIPTLRPYQSLAVDEIRAEYRRGIRRVMLVMPTGAGKTVVFSHVTHGATQRGKRTLLLAHRSELLDQISAALENVEVDHSFVAAGMPFRRYAPVHVASIQTVINRLDSIEVPDFIVGDEGHHATATNQYGRILKHWPSVRTLLVSATPRRCSGEPMQADAMVQGPSVAELIESGYLSDFKMYGPPTVNTAGLHIRAGEFVQSEVAAVVDKPTVVGDCISHYKKLADGKQAILFTFSVEHSKSMAQAFRAAGIPAEHIDGGFDREVRKSIFNDFKERRVRVLCNVEIFGEGVDIPGIECGILLRPTASEGLYLQQVGRCLRTAEGKSHAVLIDHSGNASRHGLPDEPRDWSLEGRERKSRAEAPRISVRICPQCFAACRSGTQVCPSGHPFPVEAREVKQVAGELVEIQRREARREQGQAQTLDELMAQHISRGRSPWTARTWATHVINARNRKLNRSIKGGDSYGEERQEQGREGRKEVLI